MANLLGTCCADSEEKAQIARSRAIDREIARQKVVFRRTMKILLLGSGESGKSTFLKQMRILHGRDFYDDELKQFRTIIYGNIVKGMKVLIDARDKLHIPWGDEVNAKPANHVFSYDNNQKLDETVFSQYFDSLQKLWGDEGIRTAFDRRREFQLGDSVKYFLDNLDRIGERGYVPLKVDVLHSRKATKGITEHDFHIRNIPFKFVDVGGQRSQRQKWYQCFEGVTSILFLVSSSEFDQVLFEDRKTNRLIESCNIFETIVNNKTFEKVSIILFLNKTDLLEVKVKQISFAEYFPQFQGDPHVVENVQNYELSLFDSRRKDRSKPLFHHFTTAVDTENIKFVFQAVRDTILQDNLKQLMLQ